jgi:hypothetical protein
MNTKRHYRTKEGYTLSYTTTPNTHNVLLKVENHGKPLPLKGHNCVFQDMQSAETFALVNGYTEWRT